MRVSPPKSSELHFAPPSLNLFQPYETVEIVEWVALLWILALAKARSAAPISAAISAQRATPASAKINATVDGTRQKGSWPRRSVVAARCGDAPPSLLAIRPSASTRDPLQYFNSLLTSHDRYRAYTANAFKPLYRFNLVPRGIEQPPSARTRAARSVDRADH